MELELLEPARQFCREHDFNNVGIVHQAMLKGAELAMKATTNLVKESTERLAEQRERNLNGSHTR